MEVGKRAWTCAGYMSGAEQASPGAGDCRRTGRDRAGWAEHRASWVPRGCPAEAPTQAHCYLYVLPALVLVVGMFWYSAVVTVQLSFTNSSGLGPATLRRAFELPCHAERQPARAPTSTTR